jgi:hypothetical protein
MLNLQFLPGKSLQNRRLTIGSVTKNHTIKKRVETGKYILLRKVTIINFLGGTTCIEVVVNT